MDPVSVFVLSVLGCLFLILSIIGIGLGISTLKDYEQGEWVYVALMFVLAALTALIGCFLVAAVISGDL